MTTVKVTVSRSEKWIKEQRLATGENVSGAIEIEVAPANLSKESREILLRVGAGLYPSEFKGWFNSSYEWSLYNCYGKEHILVDEMVPTVEAIDAAIWQANCNLLARRQEWKKEQEEWAAKAAEEERKKEEHKAKLAEAKVLLAADLARAEKLKVERDTLASFLTYVPQDALRGALKAMANNNTDAIDTLRKKVEDASPVQIFEDDEDE